MIYEEFLAQTDYDGVDITALEDQAATDVANIYTHDIVVKIDTPIRKTAVETVFTMNSTEERLVSKVDELDSLVSPTAEQLTQLSICKAILRSISKLFHPEYYINLGDPDVAGMLGAAEYYELLTSTEIAGIKLAAAKTETPFAYKTLKDTKAIRYPATWLDCDHSGTTQLISTSLNDRIIFAFDLAEPTNTVKLRCIWADSVGGVETTSLDLITANVASEDLYVSRGFAKAAFGVGVMARSVKFQYLSAYDGVVNSVNVSK